MPSKNTVKVYVPESFYHVYNRGVEKRRIFLDDEDYRVFLNLLKRYLDDEPSHDKTGRPYPWLQPELELLAYCLMPNHFHLLIYQHSDSAMPRLMRGVCTAYTGYFNNKYTRVGHLFQGTYKASMIYNDSYLTHISRYIHLNPEDFKSWPYSSLPIYLDQKKASWVQPKRILELFEGDNYLKFLEDQKEHQQTLDAISTELANF